MDEEFFDTAERQTEERKKEVGMHNPHPFVTKEERQEGGSEDDARMPSKTHELGT
jgi:hypothetical protein